jgi:uncharacterized protein with PIN domain
MTGLEVAEQIHALINSRPQSPTVQEIEALVNKRNTLTVMLDAETIKRIASAAADFGRMERRWKMLGA